jgi:hypothetical protein
MRELPDLVDPLLAGVKAGREQPSHAPAVAGEPNATLGPRTALPVAGSYRLRIPAERQEMGDRRGKRTIVDHDIGVTERSMFEWREFGRCRRELDQP